MTNCVFIVHSDCCKRHITICVCVCVCVCLHGCFIRSGRRVAGGVGRGGDIVDISLALRCRKPQLPQTCISAKYNCTLPQLSRTNVAAHTFWRIWRGRLTGPTVAGQSTVQSGHQRERFTHSEWFTAGFRPFPGPRNFLRCTFFFFFHVPHLDTWALP